MDLVFVTYNSEKWIDGCFESIEKAETDKINIYVADNNSSDSSVSKLFAWKKKLGKRVGQFSILSLDSNMGFGTANNRAAALGSDPYICFLNIDTQIYTDTLKNLNKEIRTSTDGIAIWELRQFPYEHPKYYNPVNGEAPWCSGAAFAIRRKVFEEISGFDEHIFMYGEDVDLSWRVKSKGYFLKYCPKAPILHYSYQCADEFKKNQFIYGVKNNLLLRYRFGTIKDILIGHLLFLTVLFGTLPQTGLKKELLKNYLLHFSEIPYWLKTRCHVKGTFYGWEYNYQRDGAFFNCERTAENAKVSIIVRTFGRPDILRETLQSLTLQTYHNFEVIVVEDGENVSQDMIEKEFKELEIHYYFTGKRMGRSNAGNIGISKANGKYINFLDDDDLFFNDHIEVLAGALANSSCSAAYSYGLETSIKVMSKIPYNYVIKKMTKRYAEPFNKIALCHHNYIPIQSIMFEKELFDRLGGLDVSLDYLEDWDLWVRYATQTDFDCVPKTTSIYRVPYKQKELKHRQKLLDDALNQVRKKHEKYYMEVSVSDIAILWDKGRIWRK